MTEKFPREYDLFKYLQQCCYKNYNQIGSDASNLMYNYQGLFTPMLVQINEGSSIKYLLELKGELPIKYKGVSYTVITSIGFPYIYPDVPCNIRIYNPDITKFSINQHFIQGASQDQSVVNIQISEIQTWYQHRSIARVIVALIRELEQFFPFFAKNQQQQQYNGQQIYNPINPVNPINPINPINPVNAIPNNQYNNPYVPNVYGAQNNQQNPNYYGNNSYVYNPNQPQPPVNYQNNPQQQYQPYQPNVQQNQYQQQNNINAEKQLRDKCIQLLEPDLKQIQQDFITLHQEHDHYLDLIHHQDEKKYRLEQIEKQMDEQIQNLQIENERLQKFIEQNDTQELNDQTILKNIEENDQFSQVILDCYSDIQAHKETLHYVVHKFKHTNLQYEDVLRLTRKVAEDQFNSILLLKKITNKLKKQ